MLLTSEASLQKHLLFLIQACSSFLKPPSDLSLGGHSHDDKLNGAPDLHGTLCPELLTADLVGCVGRGGERGGGNQDGQESSLEP